MRVQVNGESREVADQSTLEDLVRELSLPPARIAIEMNQRVVRRDAWAATNLNDGDRIEIVHFVGGGSVSLSAVGTDWSATVPVAASRLTKRTQARTLALQSTTPPANAGGTDLILT